jgi:hypothetical protein
MKCSSVDVLRKQGDARGVAKRNCLRIVSVGKSVYAYTCLNLA